MHHRVVGVAVTLEGSAAKPGPRSRRTETGRPKEPSKESAEQNNKMPEVRNPSRTALADLSGGGFFIRRVSSPGAVVGKGGVKPLARRTLTPSSNKENVPPVWDARAAPKRRSPLPDWYPRTPLRDITSIVKTEEESCIQNGPFMECGAIERRSRLSNARAQQQIQWTEDPSEPVDPAIPFQTEQGVPRGELPTQETLAAVASGPGSTQVVACLATSLAEGKLKASSSPSDCSLQTTPSKPIDPALADFMEKKLSSSIEQIEKMVRRNLKKTPKASQPSKRAVQRRTLMSMR
ncbi:hypothetical protein ACP70R_027323 [Stipagrostis hirtigluma subsp. patula]